MLDADAVVIPDAIPALPAVPDRPPGRGLEIVWVGSATHTADVAMVVDPVRTFLTEEPGARITFLGAGVPRGLNPGPRVTGRPAWDSLATCMGRLQDMAPDVVVLPLVDHPANAMRGGTAALLAAACGAAVIASARGPYARDLRHGHTARLVADSPDAWLAALRTMAHMPALRDALAVGLRAWVRTTRTMDHTGPLWAAAVTP
jgi:glycosyltransferase involved in cell wall biosynthesis